MGDIQVLAKQGYDFKKAVLGDILMMSIIINPLGVSETEAQGIRGCLLLK